MAKDEQDTKEIEFNPENLSIIAQPLADKKLTKRLLKTVKKASKAKHLKRGVKEVVKALRKGQKGFVVLAGDVSPIDVISHIPVLCEDNAVPYCYIGSKQILGESGMTKRPTSVIMVPADKKKGSDYEKYYDECVDCVKSIATIV